MKVIKNNLFMLILLLALTAFMQSTSGRGLVGNDLIGPRRDDLGDQIARFDLPFTQNAGLAWDGELIWGTCRTGERHLWCMNPENFEVVERYALDISDAIGMTYDPVDGVFWICEYAAPDNPSIAHLYDREGEHVGEIELPRGGHHDFAWDGEFFYSNSEHSQNNPMLYKLNRAGEVVAEGPDLMGLINHGRCLSIEYVPAHADGHFWVMSVGYISQVAVDWDNNEAEVIQEFRSNNVSYPHQGITHDGYNLWSGGNWREQVGIVYDDGIEEVYGVLELDREMIEFGPVPTDSEAQQALTIHNAAEEQDELHILEFTITDLGGDPDWLVFEPEEGEVEARESVEVTFTANNEGLELGEYERNVLIEATDPDHRQVEIPVHIFVVEGFGNLYGVVIDAATDEPVEGAIVAEAGFGIADTTDENGAYSFPEIPAWTYNFVVTMEDYLPLPREIEIGPDEEVQEDFALLHSEFDPDPGRIEVSMSPDEINEITLTINNPGNGSLNWSVERLFPEEARADPWELRAEADVEAILQDSQLNGVVFTDGLFYISGGNNGDDVNKVYILNTEGEQVGEFDQFNESRYGMRDLAHDGDLIWGADDGTFYGFTTDGDLETSFDAPVDVEGRSIAWDRDNQLLWTADISTSLYGIDRNGDLVETVERPEELRTYGLGYWAEDPDGFNLYAFCRGTELDLAVNKINLADGEMQPVVELEAGGGRPGGIQITNLYDPYSWVLVGLIQNDDLMAVWHIDSRTDWMLVDPVDGVVEAEESQDLTVTLNTEGYPEETDLESWLVFSHDGVGAETTIPIRISVTAGGIATRELQMRIGWSLISVNVQPEREDFRNVVQPLVDENLLILIKTAGGRFYSPAYDYCDIEYWEGLESYQIQMAGRGNLEIVGEVIRWDTPIELEEGWNGISYLPRGAVDARVALSGLGDQLLIAKDGDGNFYLPAWDFSNMGDMVEGSGYFVKVDGDAELVYTLDDDRLMGSGDIPVGDRWVADVPRSDVSYSLLLLTDGLSAGTRLEAYTPDGVLAGRGVVDSDGRCGMALWGTDEYICQTGASDSGHLLVEGEQPVIRIHGGADIPVCQYNLEWLDGETSGWSANGWGVARLETDGAVPVEFGLQRVYPNPFNGSLRIGFGLEAAGGAAIRAYDLSGREVCIIAAGDYAAGSHSLTWNALDLPSGLYILKLTSGNQTQTRKVLLIR